MDAERGRPYHHGDLRNALLDSARSILEKVEAELRKRIGPGIYGVDGETFTQAVAKSLKAQEATLAIADDSGKVLKSINVQQLVGGKSMSLDVNGDTDLSGAIRTQIHGVSIAPNGCRLVTNLELIDNISHRTVVVVGGEVTYPIAAAAAVNSGALNGN